MDAKVDDIYTVSQLHGSGDMDVEFDDICATLRGDVYRTTANRTLKTPRHSRYITGLNSV